MKLRYGEWGIDLKFGSWKGDLPDDVAAIMKKTETFVEKADTLYAEPDDVDSDNAEAEERVAGDVWEASKEEVALTTKQTKSGRTSKDGTPVVAVAVTSGATHGSAESLFSGIWDVKGGLAQMAPLQLLGRYQRTHQLWSAQ